MENFENYFIKFLRNFSVNAENYIGKFGKSFQKMFGKILKYFEKYL